VGPYHIHLEVLKALTLTMMEPQPVIKVGINNLKAPEDLAVVHLVIQALKMNNKEGRYDIF
jgi:hypothetical protein